MSLTWRCDVILMKWWLVICVKICWSTHIIIFVFHSTLGVNFWSPDPNVWNTYGCKENCSRNDDVLRNTAKYFNIEMASHQYRKSHWRIWRSRYLLISVMGFSIPVRRDFYIESGPMSFNGFPILHLSLLRSVNSVQLRHNIISAACATWVQRWHLRCENRNWQCVLKFSFNAVLYANIIAKS